MELIFSKENTSEVLRAKENALQQISCDADVLAYTDAIIEATTDFKAGESLYWGNAERLLISAVIAYLCKEFPKKDITFKNIKKLLSMEEVDEDSIDAKSPLYQLMEDLKSRDPKAYPVSQYKKFRNCDADVVANSIIMAQSRLDAFYPD